MYIGSVYTDQDELLIAISKLYLEGKAFDLDPTFNKGGFYRKLGRPRLIGDLKPKHKWVKQMDVTQLPWELWNLESIIFDPPYNVGDGKMVQRYGGYSSVQEMFVFLDTAMDNFHRVLRPGGTLVIKVQDTSVGGQNFWTHIHFINYGVTAGFELIDLFILVNQQKMNNGKPSRMARKEHCYFLVFKRIERAIRIKKF